MEDKTLICMNCESEYTVSVVYSDEELSYCPFCGAEEDEDGEECE